MLPLETIQHFKNEIQNELTGRLLPFWINQAVDHRRGGFYGEISYDLQVNRNAEKGSILNSRILWTFASAYRQFSDENYLTIANRAFDFLKQYFWDAEYEGLYFTVNSQGKVVDSRKQVYNLAFGIYGLSEYYRATGLEVSLKLAVRLYSLIEKYAHDKLYKGYFEAFSRDWALFDDSRLSVTDPNEKKSMNTHLHLMEAYTNLLRVWDSEELRNSLRELLIVFIDRIVNPDTGHFKLFFDEAWNSKSNDISFGHDIEGSWLLYETAIVLKKPAIISMVKEISINMAQKIYEEGLDAEFGGLFNEAENGVPKDFYKVWWVQAEALVGFLNAYELSGYNHFLKTTYEIWQYINRYLIDKTHGEWFWQVNRDGVPDKRRHKVGQWKCPYHNGRACIELINRLERIKKKGFE